MTSPSDIAVQEIGAALLTLRKDLVFTPQSSGGRKFFMVEDALHGRFFRLGPMEYALLSMLDGQTSIQKALGNLSTAFPNHTLTENDAVTLCQWLLQMDLAHSGRSGRSHNVDALTKSAVSARRKKRAAKWNPLTFRWTLSRSDAFFATMHRWTGWFYSLPLMLLGAIVMLAGGYAITSQWDRFVDSSSGVFAPHNWIWLAISWLVLKIVHETSHGVVCKRHGGEVRETGVMFVLLAPLAYVDVTSCWRFRSRWQKIHVAVAGMYAELWIAAIAGLLWSYTGNGWLANLCFNLVMMAGATTLVFNANPLMKFDGYYVLSDLLGMPNLYLNGQTWVRGWAKRWLLGMPASQPDWSPRERWIIGVYGWLSLVWRWMITAGLIIAATTLLRGAGVVLAAMGVALWVGAPGLHFARWLLGPTCGSRHRIRFAVTSTACLTAGSLLLLLTPWPGSRTAPAVIEYSPHTVVRATADGFIREIHVHSGQRVRQGDLLAEIENFELEQEVLDLELQIRQARYRIRQHEQRNELAEKQAEEQQYAALESQLSEKQAELNQLLILAPADGNVIARNLAALQGAFVAKGDEMLSIGNESMKELKFYIEQEDLAAFRRAVKKPVHIDVAGQAIWAAELGHIKPRASSLPHPALSANHGGPLAVRMASRQVAVDRNNAEYELLTPHFEGIVPLVGKDSLRAGLRARVIYRPWSESVGKHLYHCIRRWVRDRATPVGS